MCVLSGASLPKWPKSSPFIVEGGTRAVHVLLCGVVPTGTACPNPMVCSCGGVVIEVAHPWSTGASWSSHQILCVVGAPGIPRSGRDGDRKPLETDYARGRNLVGAEAGTSMGGLGRRGPQRCRGPDAQCRGFGVQRRGLERAADCGHSGRTQWPVTPVIPCPRR